MHFKVKLTFRGYVSVIMGYQQHHPTSQDYRNTKLTQHGSNSHFQVILFTKYNKGKI